MHSPVRPRAPRYAGIPTVLVALFLALLLLRCGDGRAVEAERPEPTAQADRSGDSETERADPAVARRLLEAIRGSDPVVCELAARAVRSRHGYWGHTPHPAAVDDPEVLETVEFAVGSEGEGTEEALAAALSDPDACVRRIAAMRLGRVGTDAAGARLTETLESGSAAAREAAAIGLGISDDARALPALTRRLSEDESARVRRAAAWALGKIDG